MILGEVSDLAQSVAVGFFVRTGSRDETSEINGVSHFLEHMLFKGTEKLSAIEVSEAFDRIGAKFNAFTSEENTVYYSAVLPEYLPQATELWIDLMRPSLRDDDFNMEKNVIQEEIAMYKDMPQFDVMDRCRTLHFDSHRCGQSVLGSNESIISLTSEQMRSYFANRYAPNNMVVACCGNFEFDAFCGTVETGCGNWAASDVRREISFYNGSMKKQRHEKQNLVCEHICLISPAVSAQDEKRFAMSLLASIIGDSTGSRFFWALVDPAIAETAVMQYDPMDGVGAMYTYILCEPDKVSGVLDIVKGIFTDLTGDGVSEEELQKARNKVLSALTLKSELPMGRLVDLGFNWVYQEKYRTLAEDVESIKAVTVGQINDLIAEFDPGNFTQLSIGPDGAKR